MKKVGLNKKITTMKEEELILDFNGAFIYMPNGIKLTGNMGKTIKNAFIVGEKESIVDAVEYLKSPEYLAWKRKYKPVDSKLNIL